MLQNQFPDFDDLRIRLANVMQVDRHRLRLRLRSIEQAAKAGKRFDRNLSRWHEELGRSIALYALRQQNRPVIQYDEELPISARRKEIAQAIAENQVVIVCGETGSGKSTQLPKICLELGRGVGAMIGHTQPRRIAARSVAARVAEELSRPLGQAVGFKIRFTDSTSPHTYIKLMTDGILLAESQTDRFLDQYDTLIIDEAHERSLNIDFILGYLRRLLPKRPDLKVIITSATIDATRFAQHFETNRGPAPVIEVSGRTYPVDLRYRPIEPDEDTGEPDWQRAVLRAVDELVSDSDGDILIFMPTERDIHAISKSLRGHSIPGDSPGRKTEIVPLYARLSTAEQNKVFQPHNYRRIVIATNVAESSLTVPGIRSVVDLGLARISRYAARSKVQRLPIEPISQASADQRKGRCGRIGPGTCIRLYSEDDYLVRDRFTAPEIQRSNLAAVILQAKALDLGEISEFPFLDPPKAEAIRDGYKTLFELGAIDEQQRLNQVGERLSKIPVDPRIGRIILAADAENCLHEMLIIASALESQDPRERPLEKQGAADESHRKFADSQSDFLSYLKLWDFYHELKESLSQNQLRKACKQNFLSYNRMREWLDLHRQLRELVQQAGFKLNTRRNDYNAIHKALLAGFLSGVAYRGEDYEYSVAGGSKAHIWPGSAAFEKKPKWLVCAEVVETSKRYLRTVARIDPSWIEPLSQHLVSRAYNDPHWDPRAASVMAFEKVSLFGLTIVARRRVRFGPIEPIKARQIFIQNALVQGDWQSHAKFFVHNQRLLETLTLLETKSRRRGLLLGEEARYDFYDARIPADVFDAQSFERWRRQAERDNPRLLFMEEEDLVREEAKQLEPTAYPDQVNIRQIDLPLDYHFEPGAAQDGVTVTIPREALNQIDVQRLGWLVPGLIEEKIIALIRSLPKNFRRLFVPVPDTAKKVIERIRFGEGDFVGAVANALGDISGEKIPRQWLDSVDLPVYLRMNIRVIDGEGNTLASGRDLAEVRDELSDQRPSSEVAVVEDSQWNQSGITSWSFDPLPTSVNVKRGDLVLPVFPALIDQGDSIAIRLLNSAELAAHEMRFGIRRLLVLASQRELKSQVDWLPKMDRLQLFATTLPDGKRFRQQVAELIADRTFLVDQLPASGEEFEQTLKLGRKRMGLAVQEVAVLLPPLIEAYHQARLQLDEATNSLWRYAAEDMREQLAYLVDPGFLTRTPWPWLQQVPRYLRGILVRLDKLRSAGLQRDRKNAEQLTPRWQGCREQLERNREQGIYDPQLIQYRWMLEEYRVSLFAQQLGTAMPISEKRLDEQWALVRRG